MTVAQLERSMSHRELNEWRAYDQIDPIGGYRQDLNTAWLAWLSHGGKNKTIEDYLIVNPHPLSAELTAESETIKQNQRLARQAAKLASGFERVKIKGA